MRQVLSLIHLLLTYLHLTYVLKSYFYLLCFLSWKFLVKYTESIRLKFVFEIDMLLNILYNFYAFLYSCIFLTWFTFINFKLILSFKQTFTNSILNFTLNIPCLLFLKKILCIQLNFFYHYIFKRGFSCIPFHATTIFHLISIRTTIPIIFPIINSIAHFIMVITAIDFILKYMKILPIYAYTLFIDLNISWTVLKSSLLFIASCISLRIMRSYCQPI